ncbi:MAG: hypothetical protein K6F04_00330 [bacterium]|nr:hypothetical protein [bacterium]
MNYSKKSSIEERMTRDLQSELYRQMRDEANKARNDEFKRQNAKSELAHFVRQEQILNDVITNPESSFEEVLKAKLTLVHCLNNKNKWQKIVDEQSNTGK